MVTVRRGSVQKSITRLAGEAPGHPAGPDRLATRRAGHGSELLPRYLTQEAVNRFYQRVKSGGSARDLALFATMYRYGLRAVEVTMLLREDLDIRRRRVRIRRAKHGEAKEYPLAADLVPLLKRYLRRRIDRGPFLFTGREANNQRGIRELTVRRLFKRYAELAALPPNVASHSLPHSIASHSLEEGFGLEYVADLLGHTSMRSTGIYAKVTTPAREEMMRRLDRSRYVVAWR